MRLLNDPDGKVRVLDRAPERELKGRFNGPNLFQPYNRPVKVK
jgi:hypothetical protein